MKRAEKHLGYVHQGIRIVIVAIALLALLVPPCVHSQSAREKLQNLEGAGQTVATEKHQDHRENVRKPRPSESQASVASSSQEAPRPTAQPATTQEVQASTGPRPELDDASISMVPAAVAVILVGALPGLVFAFRKKIALLGRMNLSLQVTMVACFAAVPLAIVVFLYLLPSTRSHIQLEKMRAVRQTVDVAYNILAAEASRAARNEISVEEAQRSAIAGLKALRYNDNDYFWINDLHPTMIMHPFKPDLDGKDLTDNKDPRGVQIFVEMANVCRRSGEGVVEYMWPKPGVTEPVPKISYVRLYKPWGWLVGSGVYVEDIEQTIADFRISVFVGIGIAFIVAVFLGIIVGRLLQEPIKAMADQMRSADLSTEFRTTWTNEIGAMQRAFDAFVATIRDALLQVSEASAAVASASAEISSSTEEMAAGAQEQTSQAAEVASAVEEMVTSISENSKNASSTSETARNARQAAENGGNVVEETVSEMRRIADTVRGSASTVQELGRSSNQIGEIVEVIQDIADQTNLLALNAAIEAARAGEQGRGFAVVADEVRKLAERTTKATKEIASMIKKIQSDTAEAVRSMEQGTSKVDEGIRLADRAGESLREIVVISQKVTDMVLGITKASEQQASVGGEIAKNVESISHVTSETAQGTQQIASAADDLNRLTEHLQSLVAKFRLSTATAPSPAKSAKQKASPRPVKAAAPKPQIAVMENG